jgi:enhancing lycopene biosynthesis protein 2
LAKCFRVGMQKTLILSDEKREARNKLIETNRLKRGKITQRPCVEWVCIRNT